MGAVLSVLGFLVKAAVWFAAFLSRRAVEEAEDRRLENFALKKEIADVVSAQAVRDAVRDAADTDLKRLRDDDGFRRD